MVRIHRGVLKLIIMTKVFTTSGPLIGYTTRELREMYPEADYVWLYNQGKNKKHTYIIPRKKD